MQPSIYLETLIPTQSRSGLIYELSSVLKQFKSTKSRNELYRALVGKINSYKKYGSRYCLAHELCHIFPELRIILQVSEIANFDLSEHLYLHSTNTFSFCQVDNIATNVSRAIEKRRFEIIEKKNYEDYDNLHSGKKSPSTPNNINAIINDIELVAHRFKDIAGYSIDYHLGEITCSVDNINLAIAALHESFKSWNEVQKIVALTAQPKPAKPQKALKPHQTQDSPIRKFRKTNQKQISVVRNKHISVQKSLLFENQEYRDLYNPQCTAFCSCCGSNTGALNKHDTPLTADHILPLSTRPDLFSDPFNIQILCEDCNAQKATKNIYDYRDIFFKKRLVEMYLPSAITYLNDSVDYTVYISGVLLEKSAKEVHSDVLYCHNKSFHISTIYRRINKLKISDKERIAKYQKSLIKVNNN